MTNFAPAPASRLVNTGLIVTLLLACGVALSKNTADPDLWGHVQYGQDALRDGLHRTATYTYSAEGHPWVNHENLAELFLAQGMDFAGPRGMLAVKWLLGIGIFAALALVARTRGQSPATLYAVLLPAALSLMHFWAMRPQLLSYVFFAAELLLLDWSFARWQGHWHLPVLNQLLGGDEPPRGKLPWRRMQSLWLSVPLMAVWANTHGAFLAGWCVLAAYLGCRGVEIIARRGRAGLPKAGFLALIAAAAGSATLLNPYGWGLHAWLHRSMSMPPPEIIEWQPPELSPVWAPFWLLLGLAAASIACARRPRDFTHLAVLAAVTCQALAHRRHIAFVALLCGLWLPPLAESLLARLRGEQEEPEPPLPDGKRRLLVGGLALACLAAAWLTWQQTQMLVVRQRAYPVAAFQFLADRQLHVRGRLLAQFDWAQYAIMAFGQRRPDEPGLQVYFDGRFNTCYPQRVLDAYFDFERGPSAAGRLRGADSPPIDPARAMAELPPDLVLIRRGEESPQRVLRERPDYVLLYQDGLAQLWGRRARYDDPASAYYLPPARRVIGDEPPTGNVPWPALPTLAPQPAAQAGRRIPPLSA